MQLFFSLLIISKKFTKHSCYLPWRSFLLLHLLKGFIYHCSFKIQSECFINFRVPLCFPLNLSLIFSWWTLWLSGSIKLCPHLWITRWNFRLRSSINYRNRNVKTLHCWRRTWCFCSIGHRETYLVNYVGHWSKFMETKTSYLQKKYHLDWCHWRSQCLIQFRWRPIVKWGLRENIS